MPIIRSVDDLPPATRGNAPSKNPIIIERIAAQWFEDYKASEFYTRDRAMPELPLRASAISKRCDRALWYMLTETPQSNPPDAASAFRMRLGQLIHEAVDEAILKLLDAGHIDEQERKQGWFTEESVDLRPAGFPGSAHGDMIFYVDNHPSIVGEFKSQGGFSFKTMATNFKGAALGPRWDHIMQGAMVAVSVGAPKVLVGYVSMESISPDLAKRMGANEYGRFTAEWVYDTADWKDAVRVESARQRRILALADQNLRPERSLSLDDVPGGAVVSNPETGAWSIVSALSNKVTQAGKTWHCAYCSHRSRCIEDGPTSTFVQLIEKETN